MIGVQNTMAHHFQKPRERKIGPSRCGMQCDARKVQLKDSRAAQRAGRQVSETKMANSHFIKARIEPAMRKWLAAKHGVSFQERSMPLQWNGQGTGSFKFDAVSDDGTILVCLS